MQTKIFYALLLAALTSGCRSPNTQDTLPSSGIHQIPTASSHDSGVRKVKELMSAAERHLLIQARLENSALLFNDSIVRYYSDASNTIMYSQIEVPKAVLLDSGYVYYNCVWHGDPSDINIVYSYSRGTADVAYGSIIGPLEDYVHTYFGYGTTAKVMHIYHGGSEICSKNIELR